MKLVIWWLSLMVVLPLIYLFFWKKSWRLPLGVVILALSVISFFVPEEIVNSLVNRKIKKEWQNLVHQENWIGEQIKNFQNKDFSSLPSSENPEKIALEKEIIELNKWIEKEYDIMGNESKKNPQGSKLIPKFLEIKKKEQIRIEKIQLWKQKWSGKKPTLPLLFLGKELTHGLEKMSKNKEEGKVGEQKFKKYSIITIDLKDCTQIEPIQKKIVELTKQEKEYIAIKILWFKNIDKVKEGSELEKFLLDLLSKREKYETWKHKEIEYNFFNFIVVASMNDTQTLSPALQAKLNRYEPSLDKYQLPILVGSGIGEVILFLILIKISRKSKSVTKLEINKKAT